MIYDYLLVLLTSPINSPFIPPMRLFFDYRLINLSCVLVPPPRKSTSPTVKCQQRVVQGCFLNHKTQGIKNTHKAHKALIFMVVGGIGERRDSEGRCANLHQTHPIILAETEGCRSFSGRLAREEGRGRGGVSGTKRTE